MKGDETGTVGVVVHGSQRPRRRRSLLRYLALYVTIVCAVAWGILLVKWINGSVEQAPGERFAQQAGQVVSAVGSDLHTVYRQAVAKVTGQEPAGDRESRAASAKGRRLEQLCQDLRQAYEEKPSPDIRADMDRSCRRYKVFLATGELEP